MGWTYKLHGGAATALGASLLLLTGLTWLPGTLPLTWAARWPMIVIAALLFPIFTAAVARVMLTGADRRTMWVAFRCLPRRAQLGLAALALSGVVMQLPGEGEGNLQSAEAKNARYYAFDTTPHKRGTVEITQSQYQAVLEADQRMMFGIPGTLFIGAAYLALGAGELRRADRGARP
ncbi:hypothetical protein [Streptomyces sp. NPDC058579]|uniref:hypothetical protein n=1 Tax=Streptomyces sp. NPDC058579 TaxID=3346548 RepID=UPI003648DAB7